MDSPSDIVRKQRYRAAAVSIAQQSAAGAQDAKQGLKNGCCQGGSKVSIK